jgi:hypothetical protein
MNLLTEEEKEIRQKQADLETQFEANRKKGVFRLRNLVDNALANGTWADPVDQSELLLLLIEEVRGLRSDIRLLRNQG